MKKLPLALLLTAGLAVAQAPAGLETIETLRQTNFPGSEIKISSTLARGSNYQRYIASYQSEGLKINGLLTIPNGKAPKTGWPVIIFNHGYIAPEVYRTTERYVAYQDGFARAGYITYKIDYRGHADSQGTPSGAYYTEGYTADVLNAVSSVAGFKQADPNRIGMWGHSMGGYLTIRAMVIDKRIKAGVVWGGVVGTPSDLVYNWPRTPQRQIPPGAISRREQMMKITGTPKSNPTFWKSVSANYFLEGIGPIQLHHGNKDETVPLLFSQRLAGQLKAAKAPYEFYIYAGNNHNLSQSFSAAMRRSVAFFDKSIKGK